MGIANKSLFIIGLILLAIVAILEFAFQVSSGYIFVLAIIGGLSIGVSINKK
ncbi:hypothetical protein [Saliterribacillus persicus]|uniref:Uncharacterized protein n=1 Tax=Saliterribacillus persicus TaxID=930114 RepID=A0A368XIA9_9BACI|nr:hypothetical protein [Saliterribacillus persicus]RCW66916.1 hypothetical protein DFR57_10811 [Saliterribacillus persicus]